MDNNIINISDFIIVQRQGYTKLHKLKKHGTISLGKYHVELDNIIGERYSETFQMKNCGNSRKQIYTLEKVSEINSATNLNIKSSGSDNRHIRDDVQSQKLTKEAIEKLIEEDLSSNSIVGQLIDNSTTFNSKTEYSQEKYIKKKEKKYFEYVQIKKPTIRILSQMYFRQDPVKILGLRTDDLSQILAYANLQSEGSYLLYDSGTQGLMPAAVMNSIGANTTGKLIHLHPGNEYQKAAFVAMHFAREQTERCINVNLYSVLRCFYQNKSSYTEGLEEEIKKPADAENSTSTVSENAVTGTYEPVTKKIKLDITETEDEEEPQEEKNHISGGQKKPGWMYENEKACKILNEKVDALIVISKEHPLSLVKELLNFLKGGRNLVVFNLLREPLQDLYIYLKTRTDFININLSNNFLRNYQVLPERTHPHVLMTSGGYLLSAYKLNI